MAATETGPFDFLAEDKAINNIIKVDHAGEAAAIRIYRGQILLSRLFYPDLVPDLQDFAVHEERHFAIFDGLVKDRGVRSCRVFFLWPIGGWVLGIVTALLGRRAIMVCTAAVETVVDRHLEEQLSFLGERDAEVFQAIEGIRAEEQAHRDFALRQSGTPSWPMTLLDKAIRGTTEAAIWLSMRL